MLFVPLSVAKVNPGEQNDGDEKPEVAHKLWRLHCAPPLWLLLSLAFTAIFATTVATNRTMKIHIITFMTESNDIMAFPFRQGAHENFQRSIVA